MKEFDFDEWAKLAQDDPVAFEIQRRKVIDEVIQSAPEGRQRDVLVKIQWKLDAARMTAKNPLDACVKMYGAMLDFVYKEGGFIDTITSLSPEKHSQLRKVILPKKSLGGKRIIPFGKQ